MKLFYRILILFVILDVSSKAAEVGECRTFIPIMRLNFVYPEILNGEKEVYKNYQKTASNWKIQNTQSTDYLGSDEVKTMEILLSRVPQFPFHERKSLFSYMFLHTNTKATASNSCKINCFKRFLVVGKNTDVIDGYQFYPKLNFYFTVPATHFSEINFGSSSLFFCGGGWDDRYKESLDILDQTDFFSWYGAPGKLEQKKCYRGYCDSVIDTIAQHGIALVLHSKFHIANDEPSLRIFEAAASSAIIISDKNQFVVDNFGDSVFYIDQNDSQAKIAEDIIRYYTWIKTHPAEALTMARRSHKIFLDKFTLEDQLLRLIHVHQETLVLDGRMPLPPRAPFLYDFTHLDKKGINAILAILMQKKFEIVNLSETQINLALTLLNPVKAERTGNGASIFRQVMEPNKGESIEFNTGYYLIGIQDLPNGKYQLKWDHIYGLTLILRGNICLLES